MLNKFSFCFLCAVSFTLPSCNSNGEKQRDTSVTQTIPPSAVTQTPSSDLALLEKKFQQDSQNVELRNMLAANYYAAGMLEKAAYHFTKVYERDNINLIALSNLGNIYYDVQQNDKAIEFYEKALALDSENIDMRCDLATCYGRINRVKKAIQILKENIKMNADHVKSHHNLSVWLKQNGDIKEADAEMKIYQTLNSEKR